MKVYRRDSSIFPGQQIPPNNSTNDDVSKGNAGSSICFQDLLKNHELIKRSSPHGQDEEGKS